MIDRSPNASRIHSFQSRLGIRLENPIYDFFRVNLKIYLELGVSHWREICIEMKEILLFANSRETEFLEKNILFLRSGKRKERAENWWRKGGGGGGEKGITEGLRRRKGTRVHFVRAYPTYHLYWCPSGVNR